MPEHAKNTGTPVPTPIHAAARTPIAVRKGSRGLCRRIAAVILCLAVTALCAQAARASQGEELVSLISQMESSYASISDYTAEFNKFERVRGKEIPLERIAVKFQKPFKVYMKWIDGPAKEALYVGGANDGKVLARCDGLLGLCTWAFSPTDDILMRESRHPITDLGFGFIIEMMRRDIPHAIANGEIEIVRMNEEMFHGRPAVTVELRFTPKNGRQYYAAHAIFNVDKEYFLPVGVACYDEHEVLIEQYSYQNVRLNAGLSELDFSKANKAYRF